MRQDKIKNYTEPIWTNSKPRGSSKVKGQVKVHVGQAQAKGEIEYTGGKRIDWVI